jgi:hypothetical protein
MVENVAEPTFPGIDRKKDWMLTQRAFRNLLDWLDDGGDSAAEKHLEAGEAHIRLCASSVFPTRFLKP